jgi:ferrous iron transport protein A
VTQKNPSMTTLDQLHVGQRARIESLRGADSLAQRMSEMGLLAGEEVEVVGFAPLGDPMEIRLQDYRLSLRRLEAARVAVSPLP